MGPAAQQAAAAAAARAAPEVESQPSRPSSFVSRLVRAHTLTGGSLQDLNKQNAAPQKPVAATSAASSSKPDRSGPKAPLQHQASTGAVSQVRRSRLHWPLGLHQSTGGSAAAAPSSSSAGSQSARSVHLLTAQSQHLAGHDNWSAELALGPLLVHPSQSQAGAPVGSAELLFGRTLARSYAAHQASPHSSMQSLGASNAAAAAQHHNQAHLSSSSSSLAHNLASPFCSINRASHQSSSTPATMVQAETQSAPSSEQCNEQEHEERVSCMHILKKLFFSLVLCTIIALCWVMVIHTLKWIAIKGYEPHQHSHSPHHLAQQSSSSAGASSSITTSNSNNNNNNRFIIDPTSNLDPKDRILLPTNSQSNKPANAVADDPSPATASDTFSRSLSDDGNNVVHLRDSPQLLRLNQATASGATSGSATNEISRLQHTHNKRRRHVATSDAAGAADANTELKSAAEIANKDNDNSSSNSNNNNNNNNSIMNAASKPTLIVVSGQTHSAGVGVASDGQPLQRTSITSRSAATNEAAGELNAAQQHPFGGGSGRAAAADAKSDARHQRIDNGSLSSAQQSKAATDLDLMSTSFSKVALTASQHDSKMLNSKRHNNNNNDTSDTSETSRSLDLYESVHSGESKSAEHGDELKNELDASANRKRLLHRRETMPKAPEMANSRPTGTQKRATNKRTKETESVEEDFDLVALNSNPMMTFADTQSGNSRPEVDLRRTKKQSRQQHQKQKQKMSAELAIAGAAAAASISSDATDFSASDAANSNNSSASLASIETGNDDNDDNDEPSNEDDSIESDNPIDTAGRRLRRPDSIAIDTDSINANLNSNVQDAAATTTMSTMTSRRRTRPLQSIQHKKPTADLMNDVALMDNDFQSDPSSTGSSDSDIDQMQGSQEPVGDNVGQANVVYRAPFFTSWYVSIWNILFMPIFTLISSCCFRNEDSNTKKLLVRESISQFMDNGLTTIQFLGRCAFFSVLWIATIYGIVYALSNIDATVVMDLFACSATLVYLLSWVLLHQQFVGVRIVAVIICTTGIALLAYMDNSRTLGSVLMVAGSALCSAVYKVIYQRMFGFWSIAQMSLFFTLIGLFNAFLMWPIALILYLLGVELIVWRYIPWVYLTAAGALHLTANIIAYFGPICTYDVFLTLGLQLAVVLSAVIDVTYYKINFTGMKLAGVLLLMVGFLVCLLPVNWNEYLYELVNERFVRWKKQRSLKKSRNKVQDLSTGQMSRLRTPSGRVK